MNSYKIPGHRVFKSLPLQGLILGLILFAVLGRGTVFANVSDEELNNRVREIAHQLRCPTCQAMSVKESEAGLSENMKGKIRELLQEGKSEEEILTFFVDRYGEWILRSPKKEGFNLVLWLTPLLLILFVSLMVIRRVLKQSRKAGSKPLTPLSTSEKSLLEKDLERFQDD